MAVEFKIKPVDKNKALNELTPSKTITKIIEYALANRCDTTQPVTITIKITNQKQAKLPGIKSVYQTLTTSNMAVNERENILAWQQLPVVKTLQITTSNTLGDSAKKTPKHIWQALMAASELHLAYITQMPFNGYHTLRARMQVKKLDNTFMQGKLKVVNQQQTTSATSTFMIPFLHSDLTDVGQIVGDVFGNFWLALLQANLVVNLVADSETVVFDANSLASVIVNYGQIFVLKKQQLAIEAARYLATYKQVNALEETVVLETTKLPIRTYAKIDMQADTSLAAVFSATGQYLAPLTLPIGANKYTAVVVLDPTLSQAMINGQAKGKLKLPGAQSHKLTLATVLDQITKQVATLGTRLTPPMPALLKPEVVRQLALDAEEYRDVTHQEIGKYFPELTRARAQASGGDQRQFKLNLMLGGRYSNQIKWQEVGLNAWRLGEMPYLLELPTLALASIFATDQPNKIYTREGLRFVVEIVTVGNTKRLQFNEGNIYEYVRRALGVPQETVITLALLKAYGKTYFNVTQLTEDEYYLEF